VMTTEEEGIGLATGAWLGGAKTALLMQSSGVGNIVNALAMVRECRIPLLIVVTMRGEFGEFNPWQVPMGQATAQVLRAMGAVYCARWAPWSSRRMPRPRSPRTSMRPRGSRSAAIARRRSSSRSA